MTNFGIGVEEQFKNEKDDHDNGREPIDGAKKCQFVIHGIWWEVIYWSSQTCPQAWTLKFEKRTLIFKEISASKFTTIFSSWILQQEESEKEFQSWKINFKANEFGQGQAFGYLFENFRESSIIIHMRGIILSKPDKRDIRPWLFE